MLCDRLSCAWDSLRSRSQRISHKREEITGNLTHKASDHRESHAQEKRSQRITHTWQEITENHTHKRALVCVILCYFLPCVRNSQWAPLLCVWFSVIAFLVCVILYYLLPCVWNFQWPPLLCVWFSVISSLVCGITENLTHKARANRDSHTKEKR
jgi:hypothetical protein